VAYYQQNVTPCADQGHSFMPGPELIERYAPLVKYLAGRIAIGLPGHVELDDLIGYGILGLADALSRYDAEKGAKFETYAAIRIKGAIYDGLRKMDWVPHSVRTKSKELESIIVTLEVRLERSPEPEEIAAELGISVNDYYARLAEVRSTSLLSLEENVSGKPGKEGKLGDFLNDSRVDAEFREVENEESRRILVEAIEKLSEKEKVVVSLYYYDELTLKEIAAILELSESRVSQLHTQAILRLRGRLSRAKKKLF